MKTIINETVEKDYKTGAIQKSSKTTKYTSNEPNFVKLYLEDISYLSNLHLSSADLLYYLLDYVKYNENMIYLNSYIKKNICKEMGISGSTLNNRLSLLNKKNVIIRKGQGSYLLNPFLFGKGDWKNIKEMRDANIELKITYNAKTNERTVTNTLKK